MMEVVKDPGSDQNQFFIDLANEYQGMLLLMRACFSWEQALYSISALPDIIFQKVDKTKCPASN